jgi:hypothetical protein
MLVRTIRVPDVRSSYLSAEQGYAIVIHDTRRRYSLEVNLHPS